MHDNKMWTNYVHAAYHVLIIFDITNFEIGIYGTHAIEDDYVNTQHWEHVVQKLYL